jgi:hypothetical protein
MSDWYEGKEFALVILVLFFVATVCELLLALAAFGVLAWKGVWP